MKLAIGSDSRDTNMSDDDGGLRFAQLLAEKNELEKKLAEKTKAYEV